MQIISKVAIISVMLLGSGFALTQSRTTNDQIVINTQRLYDLERRMTQLEQGGSNLAADTAARTTINDIKIESLKAELHDIRSVLVAVAIFVATHMTGFIVYLIKYRFIGKAEQEQPRRGGRPNG